MRRDILAAFRRALNSGCTPEIIQRWWYVRLQMSFKCVSCCGHSLEFLHSARVLKLHVVA